ncbi:MAG: type II toxin-antitoxin system RelE/ParE family toxin [Acidobacteria bacterium]|nr:type II toxin-antitoxin system RelE/ParE family toxin [Acidobacteriota bacterium]MDA1236073.1 type II toxin-antitoxin system RelE/ParE family toxin [Acidobacteriota bacterium]
MRKIRMQALAEADLVDVWIYTQERWGETQADRYFDELEAGILRLAHNPELGRACEHIRADYRALRINRHIVFYKLEPSLIRVVRILHQRMDPALRL